MTKLAVIGSRNFNNYDLLESTLSTYEPSCIISGGARGACSADLLAAKYVDENGIELVVYKPDWKIGRHAGLLRNETTIENATDVVAFWDGKSKGTMHSICLARERGVPVNIVMF